MINFDKFAYFCKIQLSSGDYDAHIPFLKRLVADQKIELSQAVELGFLYMAYYNEASAWVHWSKHQELEPCGIECWIGDLPIETQRRNLFGGRIREHLSDLAKLNSLGRWLERLQSCKSWSELLDEIEQVYGNGRWASYTTAELMLHLANLDLEPDSFEILDSSGPLGGLMALGLQPCEQTCRDVHADLLRESIEVTFSQLESLLCDWCGMCKGTFYAGRNIDRQQGRILKVQRIFGERLTALWEARLCFPVKCLGEISLTANWQGIDKLRLKHYQATGQVLAPWEQR